MTDIYVLYDRNKHKPVDKSDARSLDMWATISNKPIIVNIQNGKVYQDGIQIADVEIGKHKTWSGWVLE